MYARYERPQKDTSISISTKNELNCSYASLKFFRQAKICYVLELVLIFLKAITCIIGIYISITTTQLPNTAFMLGC